MTPMLDHKSEVVDMEFAIDGEWIKTTVWLKPEIAQLVAAAITYWLRQFEASRARTSVGRVTLEQALKAVFRQYGTHENLTTEELADKVIAEMERQQG